MKALSIRQPWAWAILHGGKDVENRAWPTKYRGRILIHASKTFDQHGWERIKMIEATLPVPLPEPGEFKKGGIVGSVELIDCVWGHDSRWYEGQYAFVLRDPRACEFKPCSGKPSLFEIEEDEK